MATIASLVVSIGADVAELRRGMDQAQSTITSGVAKMNSAVDALKATAAFGAVVQVLGEVSRAADEIDTFASKINDTARNVQRLQAIAEAGDTSMGAITAGVQRLTRTLGDGSLDKHLRTLNLNIEDFKALAPAEQYVKVAEALAGIEDPTKRAAIATDIFGKSAGELTGTFKDTISEADRWIKMSDETVSTMDRTGLSFSNATASLVNFTAELLMNITQLRTFLQLWDDYVAAPVAPKVAGPGGLTNAPLGPAADPFAPGAIGGNSLAFVEQELTEAVKSRISANKKLAQVETALSAVEQQRIDQAFAVSNRGGMFGAQFGQNLFPGIGPGQFPGFALPFENLQNTMNLALSGANANGSGAWMLREPVQSNLAEGGTGGGQNWQSMRGLMDGRMMGDAVVRAIQGGGNIGQSLGGTVGASAFTDIGKSITGTFSKTFAKSGVGKLLGGTLDAVMPGLGAVLGSMVGKLFGPSEHSKVNDQRDAFVSAAGGIHELNVKAQEAGLTLDKLLSAKKVKDFEAAVKELDGAFADMEADQERLRVAMDKYGLSIADMGQKFKQTEVSKGFKELGEDFRVLIGAGAEFNTVAAKMAPEFGAMIQTAIETGTTVPKELEPILAKMIEMGILTDRNGDKFTDLAQIPFAESMTEGFEKVVKAIQQLTDILTNGVPDAARRAVDGANAAFRDFRLPDVDIRVPGEGNPNDVVNVSRGGLIQGMGKVLYFNDGGFVPHGPDTVPAMLTPGELVLSKGMVGDLADAIRQPRMPEVVETTPSLRTAPRPDADAPRVDPPPPESVVVPIFLDGRSSTREVVEAVFSQMPRRLQTGQLRIALQKAVGMRGAA